MSQSPSWEYFSPYEPSRPRKLPGSKKIDVGGAPRPKPLPKPKKKGK